MIKHITADVADRLTRLFLYQCNDRTEVALKQVCDKICRAAINGKSEIVLYLSDKIDDVITAELIKKGFGVKTIDGNIMVSW